MFVGGGGTHSVDMQPWGCFISVVSGSENPAK